jgi:hypothetical protein
MCLSFGNILVRCIFATVWTNHHVLFDLFGVELMKAVAAHPINGKII